MARGRHRTRPRNRVDAWWPWRTRRDPASPGRAGPPPGRPGPAPRRHAASTPFLASGPLWLALLTVLALVITLLLVLARSHTSLTDRTAAVGPGTGATTGAVGSAPTGTEGAGSGTGDGGPAPGEIPAPGGGSVPGTTGDRAPGGAQGHGDRRGPAGDPAFPAPATPPATTPPAAPTPGPPRGVNAGSGGDAATDLVGGPSPVLVLGASAVVVVTLIAALRIRRGPAGGPDTRPPGT